MCLCFNFACQSEEHEHIFSSTWSNDEFFHWHNAVCEHDSLYIDKANHDYSELIIEPTCNEGGYTIFTCKICNYTYIGNEINALGHDYIEDIVEPTCTEKGYSVFTCKNCGDSYKGNETEALGHDYSEEIINPTCTEKGNTVFSCKRCSFSFIGNEVSALGHSYIDNVIEPTCTEKGYTIHACKNCGFSYKDSEVSALGHDYDYVGDKNGKHSQICSICKKILENSTEDCHLTEATCISKSRCELCGEEFGDYARHMFSNNVCDVCEKSINEINTLYSYQINSNGIKTSYFFKEDGYVCIDNIAKNDTIWAFENEEKTVLFLTKENLRFNIDEYGNLLPILSKTAKYSEQFSSIFEGDKVLFVFNFYEDLSCIGNIYKDNVILSTFLTEYKYIMDDVICFNVFNDIFYRKINNYQTLEDFDFTHLTKVYEYREDSRIINFYFEDNICVLYKVHENNFELLNVSKWKQNDNKVFISKLYQNFTGTDYTVGSFTKNTQNELFYVSKPNVLYYGCFTLNLENTEQKYIQEFFAYEDKSLEIKETYLNESISISGTWDFCDENVIKVNFSEIEKKFEIIDNCLLKEFQPLDKKVVYSCEKEKEQILYSFYDDGTCKESIGLIDNFGTWLDYENYITANFNGVQQEFIKDNGTITAKEETENFYRISIFDLDKNLVDTIEVVFGEKNTFSTEFVLSFSGYFALSISSDKIDYKNVLLKPNSYKESTYRINISFVENSYSMEIYDVFEYTIDYFGKIKIYNDSNCVFYLFDEDSGESFELDTAYLIQDGIYRFDLTSTKFGYIYAVLDKNIANKFDYFSPNYEIFCIYLDTDKSITLSFYENNFVVVNLNGVYITFNYSIDIETFKITSSQFVMDILDVNNTVDFKSKYWSVSGN